jgi:nucleotide-binding universal stress UspA family protein
MTETLDADLAYIVHATDFTPESEPAFAHALCLALAAKGHLAIIHAEQFAPEGGPDWAAFPGVRATLAKWGLLEPNVPPEAVAGRLGIKVTKAGVAADPERGLVHFLGTNRCDLLVLATHGRNGLDRLLHRSLAEALARRIGLPSLLLPLHGRGFIDLTTGAPSLQNILMPVDRDTPSAAASLALRIADLLGCTEAVVHALHVGPTEEAPSVVVEPQHAPRLRRLSGEGAVVPAILEAAAQVDADLIAMTTWGHNDLLDTLWGSTTEQVLRQAGRPLLAMPVA